MPAALHAPGEFCSDRPIHDMPPGLTCQPAPLYTGAALVSPVARPVFRRCGPPPAAAAQAHPTADRPGQAPCGSHPGAVVCPTASGPLRESSAARASHPARPPLPSPCCRHHAAAFRTSMTVRTGISQRPAARNGTAPATVGMEPASAESAPPPGLHIRHTTELPRQRSHRPRRTGLPSGNCLHGSGRRSPALKCQSGDLPELKEPHRPLPRFLDGSWPAGCLAL